MSEISVIVALYNKKTYIKSCIDSILGQTFTDFELIVIDDGSTDGSFEIVQEFLDPRLKIIKQSNSGPGIARNNGINLAKAPFIAFIDADDKWDLDFLKTSLSILKSQPECDLYLCGANWQPLGKQRIPYLAEEDIVDGPWEVPDSLTAETLFEVMNFFATGSVVIKSTIIKKYGGYFSKVKCTSGEDAYLWIQVMFNHRIFRDSKCLLIINTAGSDLGIGRKELKPIPPALAYPEHLFNNCPQKYNKSLKKLLNLLAFYSLRRELYQLHFQKSFMLWKKYPELSHYKTPDYPSLPLAFIVIPIQKIFRKLKGKILR